VRERCGGVGGVSAITTRRWSIDEWLANEAAWDGLLAQSDADPLFLSWQWLTHWWRYYGTTLNLEPHIYAFYRDGALIGAAPFYRRNVVRAGIVRARTVQMIGHTWRDPVPLISEYLDVVAAAPDLDAVRALCVRTLLEGPAWTEFVIGLTAVSEKWRAAFQEANGGLRYARDLDRSVSYHADLSRGFPAYLKELGQNTRRSVWNLRRRLSEEHGETQLEFLAGADIEGGFADLNRLHQLRWNRPAFPNERLGFHKSFAAGLAARGQLAFTRLRVAGQVVSVLYDIRKGARQYNMKMGFDPAFTSRLSLGLVHFGYAIEAAAERGVTLYDFLAGPGQNVDFKRNLGQIRRELLSVQVLRGWCLPRLFRLRDSMRRSS
jgi:CelD/BcsL family acetyltransferase involved in cellulose biosynthesis